MSKETKEKELSHRTIALKIIDLIGSENLIWALGKFWKWNGQGLWEQIEDRVIKKMIHESMDDRKITKFSIDSVLDISKTEIFTANHQFDVNTRAINCLNGELHFKDGDWYLEAHDKCHFRTTQIPIAYDHKASAPRFEQFLDEIFEGDKDIQEKKRVVCELLGYSLLTSCEFEKFVISWSQWQVCSASYRRAVGWHRSCFSCSTFSI